MLESERANTPLPREQVLAPGAGSALRARRRRSNLVGGAVGVGFAVAALVVLSQANSQDTTVEVSPLLTTADESSATSVAPDIGSDPDGNPDPDVGDAGSTIPPGSTTPPQPLSETPSTPSTTAAAVAATTESTERTTTVAPTTVSSTTVATTTPPTTVAPTTAADVTTTAVQGGNCDPNYSGCVPIALDVDCAGGSGNGPEYVEGPVTVIGVDIYGLDSDNDGVGCES